MYILHWTLNIVHLTSTTLYKFPNVSISYPIMQYVHRTLNISQCTRYICFQMSSSSYPIMQCCSTVLVISMYIVQGFTLRCKVLCCNIKGFIFFAASMCQWCAICATSVWRSVIHTYSTPHCVWSAICARCVQPCYMCNVCITHI